MSKTTKKPLLVYYFATKAGQWQWMHVVSQHGCQGQTKDAIGVKWGHYVWHQAKISNLSQRLTI